MIGWVFKGRWVGLDHWIPSPRGLGFATGQPDPAKGRVGLKKKLADFGCLVVRVNAGGGGGPFGRGPPPLVVFQKKGGWPGKITHSPPLGSLSESMGGGGEG